MLNGKYYALKIIPKYNLKSLGSINNFVPEIISSFQDYDNMYIITTFFVGPVLKKFIYEKLSEEQIQFICACIVQSLKYLREKNIIHRDLTFRNIIMDSDNYFNLIDFSFSLNYSNRNSREYYLAFKPIFTAPEILKKYKYSYNSDYYRLGNLIFFLVFKKFPLNVKKSKNLTELAIDYNVTDYYSTELLDFISKLLQNDMETRMGYNNFNDLIEHPFFRGFDWEKFEKKKIISPFKDKHIKILEAKCKKFKKTRIGMKRYRKLTKTKYYSKLFKYFEFSKYNKKEFYIN